MMNLTPITANLPDESQKYYRVPVYQEGEEHTVFVGNNFKRRFTLDTLPDFLALKLSMIKASAKSERLINDELIDSTEDQSPSFALLLYTGIPAEGFETIGWQLSKRYMLVILTEAELEELKGDTRS